MKLHLAALCTALTMSTVAAPVAAAHTPGVLGHVSNMSAVVDSFHSFVREATQMRFINGTFPGATDPISAEQKQEFFNFLNSADFQNRGYYQSRTGSTQKEMVILWKNITDSDRQAVTNKAASLGITAIFKNSLYSIVDVVNLEKAIEANQTVWRNKGAYIKSVSGTGDGPLYVSLSFASTTNREAVKAELNQALLGLSFVSFPVQLVDADFGSGATTVPEPFKARSLPTSTQVASLPPLPGAVPNQQKSNSGSAGSLGSSS